MEDCGATSEDAKLSSDGRSWQVFALESRYPPFKSRSDRRQTSGDMDSGLCAGELSGEDTFSNCSGVLQRLAAREGMGENMTP